MKTKLPPQTFEKYRRMKLQENLSSGSRVIPSEQTDGWTARNDEANSRFLQFFESAQKETITCLSFYWPAYFSKNETLLL